MGFSPPNDFVDDVESGRRLGWLILGLGGGCLALLLIFGLVFTFGACGIGKGCADSISATARAQMAPIQRLLDKLEAGDDQGAYETLSARYQETHTLEEFRAFVNLKDQTLRGGEPRMVRTAKAHGERRRYYLAVQIMEPETNTAKGIVTFLMSPLKARTADKARKAEIDEIFYDIPLQQMLQGELQAMLQRHVTNISRGRTKLVHNDLDPKALDAAAYDFFLQAEAELFQNALVRVENVEAHNKAFKVLTSLHGEDGAARGQVSYTMRRARRGEAAFGRWVITAVKTQRVQDTRAPADPDSPSTDDDDADNADDDDADEDETLNQGEPLP